MFELLTTAEMAEADRLTISGGEPGIALMENAGRAVAEAAVTLPGRRVVVVAGPGNNGGDGLVMARHLHDAGAEIGVYLLKPRADEHFAALRERNIFIANLPDDRGLH